MNPETIKSAIRDYYASTVRKSTSCCTPQQGCGCGSENSAESSLRVGYQHQDLEAVPEGANLGLGCGNPVALASLKPGEIVLDLGSGAGFDAFLASQRVGPEGRVIGVDMTPEMLAQARSLAAKHGYANVEFRQGDIEALPVDEGTIDAIISNCVINLALDKAKVFREAFRVLKPGGRIMVSDIVLRYPISEQVRRDAEAIASCLGGALLLDDYLEAIQAAGFTGIVIQNQFTFDESEAADTAASSCGCSTLAPEDLREASRSVLSAQIQAFKP